MRNLLLASTAVVWGGIALASDLPPRVPAKAAVPAPFSWTGCYIGAHAGAGWSRTDMSDQIGGFFGPAGADVRVNSVGVVGGGQVGCDYQFASNWVIGAAGDFSWASIDGNETDPFFSNKSGTPITLYSRIDFLASATGRLGYAWDHYLLYAKGGAAWMHGKYEVDNFRCGGLGFGSCSVSGSATRAGWIAGGGFEWTFASNWSALIEYNHYGFGSEQSSDSASGLIFNAKTDVDAVKVGLNYRFGGLLR